MPSLSESQLGTVRALIQAAPDRAIRDLETALASGDQRHEGMRLIHRMVNAEALERRTRRAVLAPLMPLCAPAPSDSKGVRFPPAVPGQLWRGLKQETPDEVHKAISMVSEPDEDDPPTMVFDALCRTAVAGLRARSNPHYAKAAELLDASQANGAEVFSQYLDLAAVARSALEHLPDWLGRLNEDRIVAARLAFKDAVDVAEDSGPRLLEMLYAQLDEPWLILRMISAVMHRPGDRFVGNSELATFGERLLDDIDVRLKRIAALNADGGPAAGTAAGHDVNIIAQAAAEFDKSIELSRDGPWGSRLTQQTRSLAQAVEGRLTAIESLIAAALPMQSPGFNRRGARPAPKISGDPDTQRVERARALLTFMNEVRGSADKMGYGSTWSKVSESLQIRLSPYVEDLLERLHAHEDADDPERLRQYLDIAAEFLGLAAGDKAAQIVRRRMAAA
jgi:hypothetical protein